MKHLACDLQILHPHELRREASKRRAGVATFYRQIRELLVSERFEVTGILVDGSSAVVLGSLASRVKRTGKLIETEFVFDMAVHDGLITRYHMLEDSFAVAQTLTQG